MFEDLVSPSHTVYLEDGSCTNLPALQKGHWFLCLLFPQVALASGASVVLVCLTHALREGSGFDFDSSGKALG